MHFKLLITSPVYKQQHVHSGVEDVVLKDC